MAGWTRVVLRFRWPILAAWLVILLAGGVATVKLPPLLSNAFTVPGTDSERARTILQDHFGDRSDGQFLVIFQLHGRRPPLAQLERAVRRAAPAAPTGTPGPLYAAPGGAVVYGSVDSRLNIAQAKGKTDALRDAVRAPAGVSVFVSGQPAIQHDLDPIFSHDLARGEGIAIPIAFLVLLAVFGVSFAVTIPFLFAAGSIFGTLGIVYLVAEHMQM